MISATTISPLNKRILDGAPSFVGLLDTYPNAAAAYSVRLLKSDYAGSAIQVRRSSDNTLQDIAFDANGDLDTTSLLSFVGAGSGFVRTWYDQSGNANNAQQTTTSAQPKIVNSGVVITKGVRHSLEFIQGNSNSLQASSSITLSSKLAVFTTASTNSTTSEQNLYDNTDGSLNLSSVGFNYQGSSRIGSRLKGADVTIGSGENYSTTDLSLITQQGDATTGLVTNQLKINGVDGTLNYQCRSLSEGFDIGSRGVLFFLDGNISELIFYNTNQDENISNIESNINSYYSIY